MSEPDRKKVHDNEHVLRRIADLKADGSVSSMAFLQRPSTGQLSVDRLGDRRVADVMERSRLEHGAHLGAAILRVEDVRAIGVDVVPDGSLLNPWHALIVGNFTKSIRRRLAKAAKMGIKPLGFEHPG